MDKKKFWNRRVMVVLLVSVAVIYLAGIFFWGIFMDPSCYDSNYADKFMAPGIKHLFGTDFVGRDMFYRCVAMIQIMQISLWRRGLSICSAQTL